MNVDIIPNTPHKLEVLIKDILKEIREDPDRDGLKDTPKRIAEYIRGEWIKSDLTENITVFDADGYEEMIILKDIKTFSTCEHHGMPFSLLIHVGYIPKKKIIGISKLARIAEYCSKGLQIQERVTFNIVEIIMKLLKPKGAACVMEGIHSCIQARGVKQQSSVMITSAMRGIFRDSIATRAEFLRLIGK